jgi:hypothetical protein
MIHVLLFLICKIRRCETILSRHNKHPLNLALTFLVSNDYIVQVGHEKRDRRAHSRRKTTPSTH